MVELFDQHIFFLFTEWKTVNPRENQEQEISTQEYIDKIAFSYILITRVY